MALEIESKLRLPSPALAQAILCDRWLLALCATPLTTTPHHAVYYDTPNADLRLRRWSLRLRSEGDATVATCKAPAPQSLTRNEWQCTADNLTAALPQLVALGAPVQLTQCEPFVEVCTIQFERTHAVVEQGDLRAELAVDIGTICAGAHTEPVCELELELLQGDLPQLQALSDSFCRRYDIEPLPQSKLARAWALRDAP